MLESCIRSSCPLPEDVVRLIVRYQTITYRLLNNLNPSRDILDFSLIDKCLFLLLDNWSIHKFNITNDHFHWTRVRSIRDHFHWARARTRASIASEEDECPLEPEHNAAMSANSHCLFVLKKMMLFQFDKALKLIRRYSLPIPQNKLGIRASQMLVQSEFIFLMVLTVHTCGTIEMLSLNSELKHLRSIPIHSNGVFRSLYCNEGFVFALSSCSVFQCSVKEEKEICYSHYKTARLGAVIQGEHVIFGLDFSVQFKDEIPLIVNEMTSQSLSQQDKCSVKHDKTRGFPIARSKYPLHGRYCHQLLKVKYQNKRLYLACKHHLVSYE